MKLLFIQLALGLFQTDLSVKHEIETRPEFEEGRELPGGRVRVKKLHNYGMAGGKFTGHMPELVKSNGILTLGTIALFFRLLWKQGHTIQKTGFAFLTGGALSNLYDRCRRGYVVDYLNFRTPWKWLNRLVFNLADLFIFIGTFLICIGDIEYERKGKRTGRKAAGAGEERIKPHVE